MTATLGPRPPPVVARRCTRAPPRGVVRAAPGITRGGEAGHPPRGCAGAAAGVRLRHAEPARGAQVGCAPRQRAPGRPAARQHDRRGNGHRRRPSGRRALGARLPSAARAPSLAAGRPARGACRRRGRVRHRGRPGGRAAGLDRHQRRPLQRGRAPARRARGRGRRARGGAGDRCRGRPARRDEGRGRGRRVPVPRRRVGARALGPSAPQPHETLEERTAWLEADRDERARAAVAEERARIAREMHDSVAHRSA